MPIPKERFDLSSWYDPDDNKPGKFRTAKAALIDGYGPLSHLDLLMLINEITLLLLICIKTETYYFDAFPNTV